MRIQVATVIAMGCQLLWLPVAMGYQLLWDVRLVYSYLLVVAMLVAM